MGGGRGDTSRQALRANITSWVTSQNEQKTKSTDQSTTSGCTYPLATIFVDELWRKGGGRFYSTNETEQGGGHHGRSTGVYAPSVSEPFPNRSPNVLPNRSSNPSRGRPTTEKIHVGSAKHRNSSRAPTEGTPEFTLQARQTAHGSAPESLSEYIPGLFS